MALSIAIPLPASPTVFSSLSRSTSTSSKCQLVARCHGSGSLELQSPFFSNVQRFQWRIRPRALDKQLSTIFAATKDLAPAKSKVAPLTIKTAEIIAETAENNKLKISVNIGGEESRKAFDTVLKDLAKNAPPVPGFRKAKGGKTSIVPLNVIYQIMGPKLVRKFVVEEIIKATLQDYVEKEGIKVKNELKTDQSSEELDLLFEPGKAFSFDATLELAEEQTKDTEARGTGDEAIVPEVLEATV